MARGQAKRPRGVTMAVAAAVVLVMLAAAGLAVQRSVRWQLYDGSLRAADYWSAEPRILSAGLGFDGIIGLAEIDPASVREAGGAWFSGARCVDGSKPPDAARTSAAPANRIGISFRGYADHDDGLPVVFSWPVAGETVDPTDFLLTLNNGDTAVPHAAGLFPNWERNERNVVVLFGDFGNRGRAGEADAIFPVRFDIVADASPLVLVGPGGREVSAVGMSWATTETPYDSGPRLVGAKLNRIDGPPAGEGGVMLFGLADYFPNDEFATLGGGDFRLRVLTTGGFSPDGVTALTPEAFERHFRLHARGTDGATVLIDRSGTDYAVSGGIIRVVGLSDLGAKKATGRDDCYAEDRDNYIDIVLAGDEAAARNITHVEIPALPGGYAPFYNPGGPGPEPFPEVRYTAPGPPDLEPVIDALDDPMRVDRN